MTVVLEMINLGGIVSIEVAGGVVKRALEMLKGCSKGDQGVLKGYAYIRAI